MQTPFDEIVIHTAPVSGTDEFIKGVWRENPIFIHVLGMCPTLAVTNTLLNALVMGLATLFVVTLSNFMVSSLRGYIPKQVRIACYIAIIASFVTAVDYALQAISLSVHNALGAFVPLIVVNCIILGRAEAFASKHGIVRSVLDGLGVGLGFTLALMSLGLLREILGSGTVFGAAIVGDQFEPWVIMVLPSGGFFSLAILLLLVNWIKQRNPVLSGKVEVAK